MGKILSVCIPTYNMETLLSRCLDSFILEQEYMDKLEIIVVNDGSKDKSSIIAHKYAEKYPNSYIVIDKANGNYGSCINAALRIATGKFFKICDADDRYETINLKEYVLFLEKIDTDIVFSPFATLTIDGVLKEIVLCPESIANRCYDIDQVNWENEEILKFRAMHCMATRTEILKTNKYEQTEGISYTDTQFSFYSLLYSQTCSFYDKVIYLYYLGRDGQTMSLESMKRTHYHFYINADRMIDTYREISHPLSINKQLVLFDCIFAETLLFVNVFLGNMINIDKQTIAINTLIEKSNKSLNFCPLEIRLIDSSKHFKLWKKYHVPSRIIFILSKVVREIRLKS